MDDVRKIASDILENNRTMAAQVRDGEIKLVAEGGPEPTDLRRVEHKKWGELGPVDVTVPDAVAAYIALHLDGEPFSAEEIHALEEQVEEFHGIGAPYYVHMDLHLQETGRTWMFVPEAARFRTGFALGVE